MSERALLQGIIASPDAQERRRSLLLLAGGHAVLGLVALAFSREAALAVLVVSALALLRYMALGGFAASIGLRRGNLIVLEGGLWVGSFLALGAAIVAIARVAHAVLIWAALAACLGPVLVTALAVVAGSRALASAHRTAGGLG